MVDFLVISTIETKKNIEIFPNFKIMKSKDLMIRGGDFYAIWLEDRNCWSTNEQDVVDLIDNELDKYVASHAYEKPVIIKYMWDSSTNLIDKFHKYCQSQMRDNYTLLDETILFANDAVDKSSYASKRLPYPIENKEIPNWDALLGTLYTPEERRKIEWGIGAVVTGASKKVQKFIVIYGPPGTGKSTILNIIQDMFGEYVGVFDAESLGSTSEFSLEQFKSNPLVAICQDGDLSHIERNARLNSLVSHERMIVNEKYHSSYTMKILSFLFMGTNKPVKITDAKAGAMRRLIDVKPSGEKLSQREYNRIMKAIEFEYGGIAAHCRDVFLENPHYYDDYKPMEMIGATNDFYNYVSECYVVFKKYDSTTLKEAWSLYNQYCEDARVKSPMNRRAFGEELKNYFREFEERKRQGEDFIRSYYSGFRHEIFDGTDMNSKEDVNEEPNVELEWLNFKDATTSIFDKEYADCPAQLANDAGTPTKKWDNVTTKLGDIDPHSLHYVKVPVTHIVIDFDIKDEHGNKSFELNKAAASKWPKTYGELSKSGAGIHLHYIYTGENVEMLSRIYDNDIEVKVFTGNSSLRRMLTKCNNEPIATISTGLPLKEQKMVNFDVIKNERALRTLIKRNLNKEYHSSTRCSVDFIYEALKNAYDSGMKYDVSDLKTVIYSFAAHSTHQSDYCTKLVSKMQFKSDEPSDAVVDDEAPIVFYDLEVFPNLLLINWKLQDTEEKKNKIHRMINPTPHEIEMLFKYRLVGFNNRRYDNHILWARFLGYDNEHIYKLSKKIINEHTGFFGEAYNISFTDIYDYSVDKKSLKQWEIDLHLHHQELGLDWDTPVPEEMWPAVAAYCDNDVISTEAVFNHTIADFKAREILVEICHKLGIMNVTCNDTTNTLTTKIIFRNDKTPLLNYVNLEDTFPGYEFVKTYDPDTKKYTKKNMYRGVDLGLGGYVYAEPGIYSNVALLDIASLHPHSAIAMEAFGKYTKNFKDLVDIRIHIKHKEFDVAAKLFDGALAPYLTDPSQAKQLSQALKIAINSVYGLTSATFDNPFKDSRNENNIVALRGALFMKTLQDKVQAKGFKVAHIKTDSIKIPDATPEIIEFCMKFANEYGYTFEHEATYDRMCLVNNAVYIAKYADGPHEFELSTGEKIMTEWTATGAQFQIPYVFKTLFAKAPIVFDDLCVTKSVSSTSMYLAVPSDEITEDTDMQFIGRVGQFCPMAPENGGRTLVRKVLNKDGTGYKYDSVTGTKGYYWMETEQAIAECKQGLVDRTYFNKLVDDAIVAINKYGDFEFFASGDAYPTPVYINGAPTYLTNMEMDPLAYAGGVN